MKFAEAHGTVKWFNQEKKFGFFVVDIQGVLTDIFVHQSVLDEHGFIPEDCGEGFDVRFDFEVAKNGKYQVTSIDYIWVPKFSKQLLALDKEKEPAVAEAAPQTQLAVGMKLTGTVSFIKDGKGWGRIALQEADETIFFHFKQLLDRQLRPAVGMTFGLVLGEGREGLEARSLVRIDAGVTEVPLPSPEVPAETAAVPQKRITRRRKVLVDASPASSEETGVSETAMGAKLTAAGVGPGLQVH